VGLKDLGLHRLRDLAEPEHVWQLLGEGLADEFPSLRSLDRFRGNLPIVPTSFHGRGGEVDEVAARLLQRRLVTLVGPGGVGKTRLALQTAAAFVDKFPDGTWFVELSRLIDGSALDHAVSRTLNLTPGGREATEREVILDAVREWRALLIIDNCEHVTADAAAFVGDVLRAAQSVAVLATSREPLHLPGEIIWPVEPLPVEAGAQLFVERATAVDPHFDVSIEEVAAVCRRLDGIPLALELAAARMRSMTTSELLARLDRRFRLLGVPAGHAVDGRHQSLQATVDWSFELLHTDAQCFLSRLSVMPASFDLTDAHNVSALDSDDLTTLDLLDLLVDKSLVVAQHGRGRTRYRLLETMRQYGRDRLSDDDYRELRRRHAEYFADFAGRAGPGMRSADDIAWVERVDEEFDNIRAAVEFALETKDVDLALRLIAGLEPYSQPRRNTELWAWAEATLELPNATQHPLAVIAGLVVSYGCFARDDLTESIWWGRWARQLHSDLALPNDPRLWLVITHGLAYGGLVDEAREGSEEALRIATAIGPAAEFDRVEALYQLTFFNLLGGTPDVRLAEELVARATRLGNVWYLVRAKSAIGVTLNIIGDPRASAELDEAIRYARRAVPPYWTGSTQVFAAAARPDPYDAIEALGASLADFRAAGSPQWIRRSLRDFAVHFGAVGRPDTVALIDGCAVPVSNRPAEAAAAISTARQQLGDARFEELKTRGAQASDSELNELLLSDIAHVRTAERTA
jgi:predicted ATPase